MICLKLHIVTSTTTSTIHICDTYKIILNWYGIANHYWNGLLLEYNVVIVGCFVGFYFGFVSNLYKTVHVFLFLNIYSQSN